MTASPQQEGTIATLAAEPVGVGVGISECLFPSGDDHRLAAPIPQGRRQGQQHLIYPLHSPDCRSRPRPLKPAAQQAFDHRQQILVQERDCRAFSRHPDPEIRRPAPIVEHLFACQRLRFEHPHRRPIQPPALIEGMCGIVEIALQDLPVEPQRMVRQSQERRVPAVVKSAFPLGEVTTLFSPHAHRTGTSSGPRTSLPIRSNCAATAWARSVMTPIPDRRLLNWFTTSKNPDVEVPALCMM